MTQKTSVGKDSDKRELLYTWGWMQIPTVIMENFMEVPQKKQKNSTTASQLLCGPTVPFDELILEGNKTIHYRPLPSHAYRHIILSSQETESNNR